MAERLVRLYGPAYVSTDPASPTTLFTVPVGKTYVIRQASVVLPPVSTEATTASFTAGITDLDPSSLVVGLNVTSELVGATTSTVNLVTPIVEGETLVGAFESSATAPTRTDYQASNTATWTGSTTTDGTTLSSGNFTPQDPGDPVNVYFCVTSTKASSPDTVTGIVDDHTNGVSDMGSIVTATTGPDRVSIWGGYLETFTSESDDFTATFGGTFTSARIKGVAIQNSGLAIGTPGTNNIILQTATNTGTTATAQGVTMTPTPGADSWQLLVVQCSAVASSYSNAQGGTEIADGTLATPNSTAAAYFFYPAVTNPSVTIASAGTTFAVACIEGVSSGAPNVTLSGIVIE